MKYDEEKEDYLLSNGKSVSRAWEWVPYDPSFTTEERKEIAEYMICLWKEWAK